MNIDKFLYNITKPILGLLICLIFLPIAGFSMLESGTEKSQLQTATACDFDAKLLIERSPKCGSLGGVVSVWVTGNQEAVSYFWKADGGQMFSTGSVNTLENVPANVTHWAIIRDASGCEIMLDFELAEQPCICPLRAKAVINKYPECGGANGSVRIDYSGDQGKVSFDSDWGVDAQRNDLVAGQYSVTVTDELDCEWVVDFELREGICCKDYRATAEINKLPGCGESNGSVTINVEGQTGPITYSWGDSNSMDNLAAGEYWIGVKDETTGCNVTVHFEIAGENCCVDSDLVAMADIHQQPECGKNNGSASIIATGGVAPYKYSWGELSRYDNLVPGNYRVTVTDAFGCTSEVNFELIAPENCCTDPNFSAEATINREPECGKTNGSVTLNATGGQAPYAYSWGGQPRYDNLIPGNYIVTVTDALGCPTVVNFTLVQEDCCKDTDLAVTPIINQHPKCGKNDGAVSLDVTGGQAPYAYSWGGQPSYDNLIPGNYTVTITDAFDCSTVVVFDLIEGPCCPNFAVELAIKDPTNCDQNDGAVDFIIMGTTGNLTYTWDDGLVSTDSFRTNLTNSTYQVTITDDSLGCEHILRLPFKTFAPCPDPDTCFIAEAKIIKEPDCEVSNGAVDILITGATNALAYQWSDGIFTTGKRDSLAAGNYEVTIVEVGTDCKRIVNFNLADSCPDCFIAEAKIIKQPDCEVANGTVAIMVTGATNSLKYIWEDSTLMDSVRTDLSWGDYIVIVQEEDTNCADTLSFTLENPMPPVLLVTPDTLCSDTTSIGGLQYEVMNCFVLPIEIQILNDSNQVIRTIDKDTLGSGRIEGLLPNQIYTFIVIDANGQEINTQEFEIIIPPKPDYNLYRDTILCEAIDSIEIGVELTGETTFFWSTTPNFEDTLSKEAVLQVPFGSYYIALNTGCITMDSVIIIDGSIMIDKIEPDPLCMPGTTTLNVLNLKPMQILSYDWTAKALITSPTDTTDSPVVNVNETTQFNVRINNQFGCELLDSMTVMVFDTNSLTDIRVLPKEEKIGAGTTAELSLSESLPTGFIFEWQEDPTLVDMGETALVSPTVNGTRYFATIFSEEAPQCAVIRDTAIWISCDDDALFMPNAFSPNGDGINDVLYVRGADDFISMNLIIYNRWGEKVFETSDPDFGWDGRFEGKELGPDVYGYYLTVTCPNDVITRQGNVTLLK